MKEPSAIKKTHVYLPTALYAQVQALAQRERRSVNSQIVWLLEQAMAAKAKEQPDATG
jgi:hypothetical protein